MSYAVICNKATQNLHIFSYKMLLGFRFSCWRLLIIVGLQSHRKLKAITQSFEEFFLSRANRTENMCWKMTFLVVAREEKKGKKDGEWFNGVASEVYRYSNFTVRTCNAMSCGVVLRCVVLCDGLKFVVCCWLKGSHLYTVNRVDILLLHKRI